MEIVNNLSFLNIEADLVTRSNVNRAVVHAILCAKTSKNNKVPAWDGMVHGKKSKNNSVIQPQFGVWVDCSDLLFVDSASTCQLMGLGSRLVLNTGI